jgi:nucleotide-binding universal stress UspA family protein
MKQVLVPIDGSECSLRAVQYLLDARAEGVAPRVHLVNVQPALPVEVAQFVPRGNIDDYHREQSEKALRPAVDRLAAAEVAFETHSTTGAAGERIAQLAVELGCDHIVMGTHGRGALTELLVGSTTLRVLQRAKVAVVLVK